jgi:antitoxin (DNA-binding transcriptional repressor) of toxin-antitoxin stability system
VPFRKEDEPWWNEHDIPEDRPDDLSVPELPAQLQEAPHTADRLDVAREVPCECPCCAPEECGDTVEWAPPATRQYVMDTELAFTFQRQWTLAQQHTAAAWQAATLMYSRALTERGTAGAEHVGSDLALQMNVHPRTGEAVMNTALGAWLQVPELGALVLAGELTVKHVDALLRAADKWTDDPDQAAHVIRLTLDGCRSRLEKYGWPTPAELKKRLAKVAILNDLEALTKSRKNVADARGVALWQSGVGRATLTIEGPELMLLQVYRAIEARAHAMGRVAGDERTLQQRMHDAALELLCVDADGGISAVPTTGNDGEPVTITVRGVQIVVLVPYSVLEGGDLELAEIDGYGPLLPSTARELAEQAESIRRVAIDADSGHVITVDDAVPARRRPPTESGTSVDQTSKADDDDEGPDEGPRGGGCNGPDVTPPSGLGPAPVELRESRQEDPSAADCDGRDAREPVLDKETRALLIRLVAQPIYPVDLSSTRYRVPGRLRRKLVLRDRTCTFPGCTVPGRYVDIDHRDEWPRGATNEANCHCLCRRHHRAKQAYFKVRLDHDTGDTCWVTPDGREYRRPPPTF